MILENPDILARARAIYPGARAVDVLPHVVWVRCEPITWKGRQLPAGAVMLGTSPETARLEQDARAAARIQEVWEEVLQGKHDTSQGLRPVNVFRDADGAICAAYPGDPGGRWISWETKVSY